MQIQLFDHFQMPDSLCRALSGNFGMTHVAVLDGFLGMIKGLGDMRADLCHGKVAERQYTDRENEKDSGCK